MRLLIIPLIAAALLAAAPAQAHDVKDPVCRMTVDSDTAKWKHRLGNKSFYFCSKVCQTRFAASPEKYEALAAQLERQDLHEYQVDFRTLAPAIAGQPVAMEFTIRYAKSGELVREFEIIHERLLHLLMTRTDLAWFEHQHPVRGADGRFRLTWTFPTPGQYRLYADFTPADGDNQVKPLLLTVGGGPAQSVSLRPDRKRMKPVRDLRVELTVQGEPLRMEKPALLVYTLRDRQGRPVRDMQPFIGAPGHLVAISHDGKEVIHTHAIEAASQPAMHGEPEPFTVTPAMVTPRGPTFAFKLTVPTGGLYKTWAQFMRGNRVYTVPFTFAVEDLWGEDSSGFTVQGSRSKTAPASRRRAKSSELATPNREPRTVNPELSSPVQRATIVIDGEYQPGQVRVRAGRPVELTFVRKEQSGCGDVLQFPTLGLKRTLKPGGRTTVAFTPRKSGPLAFTCGMKMYRGQVLVQ